MVGLRSQARWSHPTALLHRSSKLTLPRPRRFRFDAGDEDVAFLELARHELGEVTVGKPRFNFDRPQEISVFEPDVVLVALAAQLGSLLGRKVALRLLVLLFLVGLLFPLNEWAVLLPHMLEQRVEPQGR